MKTKSILKFLLVSFLMTACAEQEKFHEMRDATVDMKNTTEEMNQRTGSMAKTTENLDAKTEKVVDLTTKMNDRTESLVNLTESLEEKSESLSNMTNELYDALRQGNSLQLRREAYDAVLKAPTMVKKISEAGKYFMSFEVQLWNQFGLDGTEEKRDSLAQQATQEFFLEIEGLGPRDGSIDPTAKPNSGKINSEENLRASFNAMAIAMHQMNRKQSPAISERQLQPISMLSLMEQALLSKKQNSKESLGTKAAFIREVLAHEPKAIQLLQARYNLFPAVFVDFISHINDKHLIVKAWMALTGWELNLDTLNAEQLEYLQTEVLSQAIHSRNLLKQLGIKPVMNFKVSLLLKNMKIKANGKKDANLAAKQTALVGLLTELKKDL